MEVTFTVGGPAPKWSQTYGVTIPGVPGLYTVTSVTYPGSHVDVYMEREDEVTPL